MRYQDYVIKDGQFVGRFEDMYRDCPDPWHCTEQADSWKNHLLLGAVHSLRGVRDALDVGGLAQCLDRLDPDTARRMGEAARETVLPLTPEAMGREYLALYERLLAGKLG